MSIYREENRLKPRKCTPELLKAVQPTWGEVKRDGYRLTLVKELDGATAAYFAIDNKNILERVYYLAADVLKRMPAGTIVDGECHSPGERATNVMTRLIAKDSRLVFDAFAIPKWAGVDLTFKNYEYMTPFYNELGVKQPEKIDVKFCTKERAVYHGIEGYILKQANYWGWLKVKPVETVDCFVIGSEISLKGQHFGKLGSLHVAVYDRGVVKDIGNVGKGADKEWRHLTHEQVLGRVLEVQHEGIQAKGKMKFSSFIRWRDDKKARECKIDQLL